jgi:DNA helicase-2/ATP-dependent DNA helicase PcrA
MNPDNPPRFTARAIVPTPEQSAIQLSQDKVVLIDANAGAAKTTTLALRIGEALARGLPPEQILALVFTPEARDVMRQRLVDIGIARPVAARVKVSTVEDFAAEVLAGIEGGTVLPPLAAKDLRRHALNAIGEVGERYRGRFDYLDPKTHNVAISQFLDAQQRLKATLALEGDFEELSHEEAAAILDVPLTDYLTTLEYERIRLGSFEGTLFRGPHDAAYDLARSLAQTPELVQQLPAYRVLVCDELHDMNEAAFRILSAMLSQPQCYVIGAGDKDQVIHARLGASNAFLQRRFAAAYPGLVSYPLTASYRYGPSLAFAMADFKQKTVSSSLSADTAIRQAHYADGVGGSDGAAAQVVVAIADWQRDRHPLSGCAVLVRNWDQAVAIENALMQAGILYRTEEMPSYLRRPEILFLRGMVAIALKNLASVRSDAVRKAIVEALAMFAEVELAPEEMDEAKKIIARDPDTLAFFFSGQLQRAGALSERITTTVAYAENVAPETPAAVVLAEICRLINLELVAKRIYVHPYDAKVVVNTAAGLIAAAEAKGMNLRDFSEWLGAAEQFAETKAQRQAVLLEAVEYAKGKEFDHVILPCLEVGAFPNAMFPLAQEENLFYVAATRARVRLTLLSPLDEARRSPFIGRMLLAGSVARAAAAVLANAVRPVEPRQQAGTVSARVPRSHGPQDGRRELKVPFAEKDAAKALGAEWDLARRVWYVRAGADPGPFKRWLPD